MKQSIQLTVYAPIDHLPAEGFEYRSRSGELNGRDSLIDFYREALSQSDLIFDLSSGGSDGASFPAEFGKFTLQFSTMEGTSVPMLVSADESVSLDLAVAAASDASEPQDLVRGFLDRLRPALDEQIGTSTGRRAPLIRWEADEAGERARVQLLGILEMPEDEFDSFLEHNADFDPILEEAEVEAHGLRETAAALAVLGITALSAPDAEAGLFKNLFGKKDAPVATQVQPVQKAQQAPRQGWVDVHKDARIDKGLIESHDGTGTRIIVDVSRQRAFVLVNGRIAIDTAVSTARSGKYTPRGSYSITEKVRSGKHSTIYGCEMPYWMRLGDSPVGLHIGDLPGYAASAGCVRLPYSVAPVIFDATRSGTQVKIVDSWDLATNLWADEDAAKTMMAVADPVAVHRATGAAPLP